MDSELVPLSGNEAGKALGGVSRSTVYGLVDRHELVRVNIGARAFITRQSINAYIERLTAMAQGPAA